MALKLCPITPYSFKFSLSLLNGFEEVPYKVIIADVTSHSLIKESHNVIELILRQVDVVLSKHVSKVKGRYRPTTAWIIFPEISPHVFPVCQHVVSDP